MHTVRVELFHTMLQWYRETKSWLFSFPFLVILDIQVTFIVVLLSIEHICLIYFKCGFSNVGRFFLLGAVKVENGGESSEEWVKNQAQGEDRQWNWKLSLEKSK